VYTPHVPDLVRQFLTLFPIGLGIGFVGSLIGVGGGFFVVPLLLLALEGFTKESATAASLGIVFLGSLSATVGNVRRRRVDYRTGLVMAAGTLPGAWLGRVMIDWFSDRAFRYAFAGLLASIAFYLIFVRLKQGKGLIRGTPREVRDSEGQRYAYEVNLPAGFAASLGVGVISSLFGVGGGLILVPFMVIVFGAPTIVATSCAQFVFVFTTAAGVAVAAAGGQMTGPGLGVVLTMGPGAVLGAQLGVAAAKRVPERLIRGTISAVLIGVAALMFLRR